MWPPPSARALSRNVANDSGSVTSNGWPDTGPSLLSWATADSSSATSRSPITTRAPRCNSARAVAKPMPLAAPVMAMVLPRMLSMAGNFTGVNFVGEGVFGAGSADAAQHNGAVQRLRFVPVNQDDELAQPLIAELAVEYATRYNGTEARVLTWLRGYPGRGVRPA